MKAEVLRELGRFADASALFARMAEGVNQRVAAIIRRLVDDCDPYVRRFPN